MVVNMKANNKQEKKTYFDILILCRIIAILAIWYYWPHSSSHDIKQVDSIQKIHVIRPLPQDITSPTSLIGYVTPIDSVEILPYISGFIDKANVKGGEQVKAGDLLFLIRQEDKFTSAFLKKFLNNPLIFFFPCCNPRILQYNIKTANYSWQPLKGDIL